MQLRTEIAALTAGLTLLAGCVSGGTPTPHAMLNAQVRDLTPAEKTLFAKEISMRMKDPDSTKILWLPVLLIERNDGAVINYCGYVNGKNSYGGHVGYKRFYAQLRNRAPAGSFDFDKIDLRLVSTGDTFDPADGLCEQFGYNRFSMPSA